MKFLPLAEEFNTPTQEGPYQIYRQVCLITPQIVRILIDVAQTARWYQQQEDSRRGVDELVTKIKAGAFEALPELEFRSDVSHRIHLHDGYRRLMAVVLADTPVSLGVRIECTPPTPWK